MGQAFSIYNHTRKEFIHPHAFGDGYKLFEFVSNDHGTMTALGILLAKGSDGYGQQPATEQEKLLCKVICGRWSGDQVAIIGEYEDQPEDYVDISEHVARVMDCYTWLAEARNQANGRERMRKELYAGHTHEGLSRYDAVLDGFVRLEDSDG